MNDSEEARRADQALKETIIQQGIIRFLCIDNWTAPTIDGISPTGDENTPRQQW